MWLFCPMLNFQVAIIRLGGEENFGRLANKGQGARLTTSALHQDEEAFFDATAARLSEETKAKRRQLIDQKEDLAPQTDLGEVMDDDPNRYLIHELKSGPGDAKIANLKKRISSRIWGYLQ